MKFESESQLSVRCFKCGCFGHRGSQCDDYMAGRGSQNLGAGGMLEKCWICGFLGHRAANCKEKTVTCFSCGERGHKQEDCCSPMANCWNCGKRGHIKKNCPVKTNVGMCFYCHEVGHHSKDCDKKVCYICQSKNHLWTRCPLKGTQGFSRSTSGYMRGMGYMSRGENHQKAIQVGQFPNQLQFDDWCYQSLEQQQQTPRCLRPNSMPVLSNDGITINPERPMPLRTNSDPNGYSGYLNPLYRPRMSQTMDDFQLVPNLSSWSSVTPRTGNVGQRSDQDSSGFSMADVLSRSNESLMKMTESEKESCSVMLPLVGRRNSLVENCITPRGGSSEAWCDGGLHVVPWARDAGSVTNPLSEKQAVTRQNNSIDPLSSEVNRLVVNTPSEKQELLSAYDGVSQPKGFTMNQPSEKQVVTSGNDAGDLPGYEAKRPLTKIGKKEVVTGGYNSVDPPCREEKGSLPNRLSEKQSFTGRYDNVTLSGSEAKESIMSTLSEKHGGTKGYNDGDLPCTEKKKYCGETTIVNSRDGDTLSLQNQQTIQPAQETQAESPDVVDAHDVAGTKTTVETSTNVINTNLSPTITSTSTTDNSAYISELNAINTMNRSPTISSTLIKDRNVHTSISVSTMSSVSQEDVKDQTIEVIVPEASVKTSNSLAFVKTEARVKTQVNDVQEDLKIVREQLAEAKTELDEKREELDKTKKIVEHLRSILFLESSFKTKSCPKNYQEEDLSSRCPKCIQILKNVESCEVCMSV